MGDQAINEATSTEQRRRFTKCLLDDVRALEMMLEQGMIESGIRRIGAEQEVFLVNKTWHPAPKAVEVLEELDHPDFTTELARFNLEFNLDPLEFSSDCLSQLETQLNSHLQLLREAAARQGVEVVLTGILPTLTKSDLDLANMSPRPRYFALNEALKQLKGADYEFRIEGTDDLIVRHDSVMLESCNTSFQIHFQVGPSEFAHLYNIAQLVTAPLLAAASNSPLLFGRRLWRETRIALFQQSIDTRQVTSHLREARARVHFGEKWIHESVLEIFREDIARYRVLLAGDCDEDPFEIIAQGKPPNLKSLCLHNGTIYRWNRPCYGVTDGKAHLRIENRVIPSGPSILDAVANAAFYFGMMISFSHEYKDVRELIDFSEVHNNFLTAARSGLGAQFTWLDGKIYPAQKLICERLIPMARQGLLHRKVNPAEVERYLGVLQQRVESCITGSQWLLDSLIHMKNQGVRGERLAALTAATANRQKQGMPVHEWAPARLEEAGGWKPNYMRVEQFMTTDLFTVSKEDTIDLVANMMNWERIRHIPVEDNEHHLVGLISYRSLLKYFGDHLSRSQDQTVPVTRIMKDKPITVPPETPTVEAMAVMKKHQIGCLPVVKDGRLLGVVTERDFMDIARDLLEQKLREEE